MTFRETLVSLEQSLVWEIIILVSILASIFGPPIGIILGISDLSMIFLIVGSNIFFVVDTAINAYCHGRKYLFSVDFLIDISAIISAVFELAVIMSAYSGPTIVNLRVLRAMKLLSRSTRSLKTVVKAGKLSRVSKISKGVEVEVRHVHFLKQLSKARFGRVLYKMGFASRGTKASTPNPGIQDLGEHDKYLSKIRRKMQTVVMILMGYIIIRFGVGDTLIDPIPQAWIDIKFFAEMILIMIFIGGIIDFYLNKLVGQRFRNIEAWVERKSSKSGFFSEVNKEAHKKSTDEVDFLERYIGIVLNKTDELPQSVRKYLWGVFKPAVEKKIIFLSDIENYSGQTANMDAKHVNSLLNKYVDAVVHILTKHGADIDKYVGDSIIAFFNPDQAAQALEASKQIATLQNTLKTRVGLHYDSVMETYVGPKGFRQMDHFSEGLSIAQRIEDYNKKTKTYVLFSKEFHDLLPASMRQKAKQLKEFKPKGAKRKFTLYTI